MKRYIKCNTDIQTLLFKAIKLFNKEYDHHISLNKDKTAFRYATYEKDFYEFGYITDLEAAFNQILESDQYDVQSDDNLLDALTNALELVEDGKLIECKGAHHSFEVSSLNTWVKSKNREYGFSVLLDDDGYDKAQVVQNVITELCNQHDIPVSAKALAWIQEKWDSANGRKYIATVKPKLREVKFTCGYGGLAESFVDSKYKKEFIQMLKDNISYVVNKAGLVDMAVNDRTGSIIFHY